MSPLVYRSDKMSQVDNSEGPEMAELATEKGRGCRLYMQKATSGGVGRRPSALRDGVWRMSPTRIVGSAIRLSVTPCSEEREVLIQNLGA